ncbi:MAG TPA: hypothetical protein VFO73_14825 [Candidatus Limnocylindrales bacterium]|nr:hypothetical protein [Candidatus Limnocylindrales bacterium]
MTTITEKKSQTDVIAVFLIVVFGLAAWRGAERAPIMAGLAAVAAVGVLAIWLYWRRKPAAILAISPDEIFFGRLDQTGVHIRRGASGRLRFRQGFKQSGWFLMRADEPEEPAIAMIGFDLREVEATCIKHGWTFGEGAPPAVRPIQPPPT